MLMLYNSNVFYNITRGRVLSGELYAQRFQKFIYVHLFTDCFMKISQNRQNKSSCNDNMIVNRLEYVFLMHVYCTSQI